MSKDDSPELELRINVGMSNEEYLRWNIEGASRMLRQRPEETAITFAVYRLHKEVLRTRGVPVYEFEQGDRIIEDIVKQYQTSN